MELDIAHNVLYHSVENMRQNNDVKDDHCIQILMQLHNCTYTSNVSIAVHIQFYVKTVQKIWTINSCCLIIWSTRIQHWTSLDNWPYIVLYNEPRLTLNSDGHRVMCWSSPWEALNPDTLLFLIRTNTSFMVRDVCGAMVLLRLLTFVLAYRPRPHSHI